MARIASAEMKRKEITEVEGTTREKKERAILDKQASGYDNRVLKVYKNAYDLSIQKIRSVLSPDQQVLEIGLAPGSYLSALPLTWKRSSLQTYPHR